MTDKSEFPEQLYARLYVDELDNTSFVAHETPEDHLFDKVGGGFDAGPAVIPMGIYRLERVVYAECKLVPCTLENIEKIERQFEEQNAV